mgnify:CR=1 FL=1
MGQDVLDIQHIKIISLMILQSTPHRLYHGREKGRDTVIKSSRYTRHLVTLVCDMLDSDIELTKKIFVVGKLLSCIAVVQKSDSENKRNVHT